VKTCYDDKMLHAPQGFVKHIAYPKLRAVMTTRTSEPWLFGSKCIQPGRGGYVEKRSKEFKPSHVQKTWLICDIYSLPHFLMLLSYREVIRIRQAQKLLQDTLIPMRCRFSPKNQIHLPFGSIWYRRLN